MTDAGKVHVYPIQYSIYRGILSVETLFDVLFQIHDLFTLLVLQAIHGHPGHAR